MKNKVLILIIVCFTVGLLCLYYFYQRKVSFELAMEIPKPYLDFDRIDYVSFDYVENKKRLMFYMVDYYKEEPYLKSEYSGYDSIFVENISKELNFDKYNYIITYQKQLKALTYSPYLAKKEDFLSLPEKPLIPTFDTIITDKVYIYRIRKNNKYRAPGP